MLYKLQAVIIIYYYLLSTCSKCRLDQIKPLLSLTLTALKKTTTKVFIHNLATQKLKRCSNSLIN